MQKKATEGIKNWGVSTFEQGLWDVSVVTQPLTMSGKVFCYPSYSLKNSLEFTISSSVCKHMRPTVSGRNQPLIRCIEIQIFRTLQRIKGVKSKDKSDSRTHICFFRSASFSCWEYQTQAK